MARAMNDDRLDAYKNILRILPRDRADAFHQLMSAHGLRPTDPSIIGVVLQFMLSEQQRELISNIAVEVQTSQKEFRKLLSSGEVRYIVAVVKGCLSMARPFWASIAIALAVIVGAAFSAGSFTKWLDDSTLHARVCTAEMRYVRRISQDAQETGSQTIAQWIGKEPNADCGS